MTMRLSVLIDADGKVAKAEVVGLENAVKKLGPASETASKGGKVLQASNKKVSTTAKVAETTVEQLTAAEIRNAAAARQMGAANQIGAGGVANLTAQFNDIGVMLAAGQNPLQLAIQQGTQITQVFGNAGAASAGKALFAALRSMISPMNLLTIGTIAGGAALFQWATQAGEADAEADALGESLANIKAEATDAATAIRLFYSGLPNADVLAVYDQIAAKEAELKSLRDEAATERGRDRRATLLRAQSVERELEQLRQAVDLRQSQVAQSERLQRIQEQANRAGAAYIKRIEAEREAAREAGALVEQLQREAEIRELIARFGEESREVAAARVAAEREVFAESLRTRNVSEETKTQLLAAWDAAKGVAGTDMASGVTDAGIAAERLAERLGIALSVARSIAAIGGSTGATGPDAAVSQVREAFNLDNLRANGLASTRLYEGANRGHNRSRGGGGRSRAAREAEREQKAIDDLIASLTRQKDILRETDPVQKEMIRNRRVLTNATKEERTTVEELIEARIREEAAIESASARAQLYGSVAANALDSAIVKGESLDDVLKNVAASFADAAIQAAIFGDGPFGDLFGGTSLIDLIIPQKKAAGGKIFGAGGPRDDKVPVLASAGEYIVNANATAQNLALLEAINAGAPIQRRADGGIVGARSANVSVGSSSPGGMTIHMHLAGARGDAEIAEASRRGMLEALEEYDRQALPGRVSEITSNPRFVG